MCIVVLCDCFTGIFAGFTVFSTIGFLAKELNTSVSDYAKSSGPGLAFITYPEAITKMSASPFFSIIFFLMLLALGLGSQFALTDVPVTSLCELYPRLKNKRSYVAITTCVTAYFVSLPFTCPGGYYWFELIQEYAAALSMVVVGFFEVICVSYIYGFNRFMNNVKMMLGKRVAEYYLFLTWNVTAPLLMLVVIISSLIQAKPLKSENYLFPTWSIAIGWIIFILCIIPIPIAYVVNYIKEYQQLRREESSVAISHGTDDHLNYTQNYEEKPRYLQAFLRNNAPADDWGPKKEYESYRSLSTFE
ncbi:unnamed protein product [Didymodactylos carnosus]|uniref:Uncharacterized protein n=1 Tax=Didymodactylos carnosus TaxID=1234261 RepID=A0A815YPX3_9BILA|nr:unnamed protein product [Didymodactylos carnosus]CAF4437293.1 unnamed protein product [Didymodactylos carnosus]